jgi:PAS domain S-box-containing protein
VLDGGYMSTFLNWLLPANFLPHGHCYLWRPDVLWLHVGSDGLIAASYYALPVALAYFVRRRRAVLPYWWVPALFATFIFLCGTTHVMSIWTVWHPDYVVDGLIKLATAVISAATAVMVFAALPHALALRTPIELQREVDARTAELSTVNARLRDEIFARERTESALREKQLRVQLALEAARAATWVIDYAHGAVEQFDARACELGGLDVTRPHWPSGTFCALLHPQDRALMQQAHQETCATTGPGPTIEYRIARPNGGERWLQGTGIVERDASGKVRQFIGVSIDITAGKHLEEELRLTIEKLHAADSQKDQFLATLGHELRNPLAPISNSVQIIKRADSAGVHRRTTDIIERQLRHLVRLVDDLLDISRVTRGLATLRHTPLAVSEVLARALESSWTEAETKRLELVWDLEQSLHVYGDSDRLTQVFANILGNAAKFTAGHGKVWISARRAGNEILVSIRDTGIGIPPEALQSIFQMFSQLRAPGYGESGLGIGLALVHQLVQLHGGRVEARSAGVGSGAEFIVHLPSLEAGSASGPKPGGTNAAKTSVTTPRRVLVVDDNDDSVRSLSALLNVMGHEVREARDGPAAIELVQTFRPQLVFMDIGLPRMDGLETTQEIRKLPLDTQPLIVALTGWGQEIDRERSRRVGIAHHLTKPIEHHVLQRVLELADPA